jgi:conjugative relaxase-like TrwC/TraI family protein
MLTIGKLGASAGQLDYYERQVAAGAEDYYAGRGESPGTWMGGGLDALSVAPGSRVEREAFLGLMQGRHPVDGSQLRRMTRASTVAAIDLTFSAPKSVSVLYAVAGGEMSAELSEAHERAVAAAVSYLEREACLTRRGHAGAERVAGEGFVAAAYRHRLSRAGDPQLHTHVVAANLTRADGRFTSLDAHALYEHKSAAGAVYRAVLRAEVCDRLPWVQWRQAGRGLFEIDGVPEDVLRHFSQRLAEIEERAVELVGAEAARSLSREQMQGIALATRRPKARSRAGGEQWREDARARSAEHGFGPDELWTFVNRPEPDRTRPSLPAAVRRLSGPEGLTGSHNTFTRRHAVAEIAGEFTDGIALDALERATDRYLADPSVCELGSTDSGEQRFTTKDLLACERSILDDAVRRYDSITGVIASRFVDVALREAQPALNADQAAAVRAIATSGNGVDTIQALAGTGKTTMMRTLADAYHRAGYDVYGTAPTARAARELRDVAGVPASTMHALACQLDGRRLRADTVLLLDEAGMAGTRISAEILGHAQRAGVKVVAVGDRGQLTSVQAGGWFAVLTEMQSGPELRQVLRQRDPAEREALAALHDGNADAYLEHKADDITIHATERDAVVAVVEAWLDARERQPDTDVVMIARDNVTREQLNHAARARLQTRGDLSGELFLTEGREWRVGDRIITRRNDRRLDVDNGTLATITRYDRRRMAVQIQTDNGEHRCLDLHYLARHVEHAYAITGHSSQGATIDHALVVGRPEEFTREWAYTVLSRARGQTSIHVMADLRAGEQARGEYAPTGTGREPHECLRALRYALGRSDTRRTAAELTSSQTAPALEAGFGQRLRGERVAGRPRRYDANLGR